MSTAPGPDGQPRMIMRAPPGQNPTMVNANGQVQPGPGPRPTHAQGATMYVVSTPPGAPAPTMQVLHPMTVGPGQPGGMVPRQMSMSMPG